MPQAASIVGGESYKDRILRDGAVGYWRLGEASGTAAYDLAPTPHNGTYSGGVTLGQAGPIADGGTAALFNGSTGKATVATFDPLNGLTQITLEAWVDHNGVAWSASYELVQSWGAAGGGFLAVNNGSFINSLMISGSQRMCDGGAVPTTGWHQVAMTWTSGDSIRSYLDVALTGTSTPLVGTVDTAPGLHIGTYGNSLWFAGSIGDVAIYPTALTAQQVAEHYGLRLAVTSGLRIGGAAPIRHGRSVIGSGGLRVGGTAPIRHGRSVIGSGGLQISGAAPIRQGRTVDGSGGLVIGGTGSPVGKNPKFLDVLGEHLSTIDIVGGV